MLSQITRILMVVGGLNWGLVGIGMLIGKDLNVVSLLLGFSSTLVAVVYILVGASAIYSVWPR